MSFISFLYFLSSFYRKFAYIKLFETVFYVPNSAKKMRKSVFQAETSSEKTCFPFPAVQTNSSVNQIWLM